MMLLDAKVMFVKYPEDFIDGSKNLRSIGGPSIDVAIADIIIMADDTRDGELVILKDRFGIHHMETT